MRIRAFLVAVCLVSTVAAHAQSPDSELPPVPELQTIEPPVDDETDDEQSLEVFTSPRALRPGQVSTNAVWAGDPGIDATLGNTATTTSFSVFYSSSSPLFRVRGDGNVGIGTGSPTEKLEVAGDMLVTGALKHGSGTNNHITGMRWNNIGGPYTGYIKLITPIVWNESNIFTIVIDGYQYQGDADAFSIRCSGYAYYPTVGLTQTKCDVSGTDLPVEVTTETRAGSTEPVVVIRIGTPASYWYYAHFSASYKGWKAKSPASFTWVGGETTPAPGTNLNNVIFDDKTGTGRFGGNLGIGSDPHSVYGLYTSGNPDLTTFPNTPASVGLRSAQPYNTANNGTGIAFDAIYNAAGASTTIAAISGVKESTADGNYAGALTFGTRVSGASTGSIERMRVRSTGEVVIGQPVTGTSQPLRLTVNGNIVASGSITGATVLGAVYQDLAEWVPSTADLVPGTVVVLNPADGTEVMASSRAYDTSVAGVVSAQPGIVLGVAGDTKEQVATTGRVKVRVDARNAPVRVGDLLVTSDVPGTAMKSIPMDVNGRKFHQPGTIIGKALEPLDGGIGEILVLLSMQ